MCFYLRWLRGHYKESHPRFSFYFRLIIPVNATPRVPNLILDGKLSIFSPLTCLSAEQQEAQPNQAREGRVRLCAAG